MITNNMRKKDVGKKFRMGVNKTSAAKGKLHTLEIFFLFPFSSTEHKVVSPVSEPVNSIKKARMRAVQILNVLFFF